MAGLAYIVNNGYSSFQDKIIKLDSDINLSDNIWIGIGLGSNTYFKGSFDGNHHTISGLHITKDSGTYPYYGLFNYLNGTAISNLSIIGNINLRFSDQAYPQSNIGGLVGYAENCIITNVKTFVNIDYAREKTSSGIGYEIYIGGVGGQVTYSTLTNCINAGNMFVDFGRKGYNSEYYSKESVVHVGGISGSMNKSFFMGCGNVNNKFEVHLAGSCNTSYGYIRIGGVAGSTVSSGTTLRACYNNSQQFIAEYYGSSTDNRIAIGGICSSSTFYSMDSGGIYNCYSSTTQYTTNTRYFYYGGISGLASGNATNKRAANFSPNNLSVSNGGIRGYDGSDSFSQNQMSTDDFLNELNIYPILSESEYCWIKNNIGFPYFILRNDSSISDIEKTHQTVHINGNTLSTDFPTHIEMYTLEGKCYFNGSTDMISNIPKGIYILKIAQETKKIIIR